MSAPAKFNQRLHCRRQRPHSPHSDSAPTGVQVIDLSKYTVVPGLIDSHAHVLGNPKDQSSTGGLRMSSAQKAIWGVRNLQVWLDHGFTALRDACEGDPAYGQLALRDSIAAA